MIRREINGCYLKDCSTMDEINSTDLIKETKVVTRPIRLFVKKCLNDWSFDLSSMVAYSLLVTIFPIAVTILGFIGLILKDNIQTQNNLKNQIINSFPSDNTTQTGIKQVGFHFHHSFTKNLLFLEKLFFLKMFEKKIMKFEIIVELIRLWI